jgi:CheY-like chemotaxis protein
LHARQHVSRATAALGALANSRSIDVVLSDLMMPGGLSGVQLAREIRLRQPNLLAAALGVAATIDMDVGRT